MTTCNEKQFKISDYLILNEAALFMGVPVRTLRHWTNKKKIKCYRHPINRYRLFKKEDLEKFLIELMNIGEMVCEEGQQVCERHL